MRRHTNQRGSALILLIGITATLALLSATLVFVIQNQQYATAKDRATKQSFYAADAALDSAVQLAKGTPSPIPTAYSGEEWLSDTDLEAAFAGQFPTGATVDFRVYDNLATVDYDIHWDSGGPYSPSTPDGMVWVEATVTYQGKTTRTRALVRQVTLPFAAALPKAVTYSDTGINLKDHSDIYAVNADGSPLTSGMAPTAISAGGTWTPDMDSKGWNEVGRLTLNRYADLAAPGYSSPTLGIKANGSVSVGGTIFTSAPDKTVSAYGHTFTNVTLGYGTVGFLSDYFDQAAQADLADESQAAVDPVTGLPWANAGATVVSASMFTPTQIGSISGVTYSSSTKTYTFANDIRVNGSLTFQSGTTSGRFSAGTRFNFKSLYVTGSLTISGQLTFNTRNIYIGENFTITGPTSAATKVTHTLGSIYVRARPSASPQTGFVNWNGYASVSSRDYQNPSEDPRPMWMGMKWERSGTYNDEYGPTWVPGNSSTSIVFSSSNHSTIMCPLLCTTEKTTASGDIDFGTRAKPMVYFFMCDNNGIYPMTVEWSCTGTFYGLMVINEAPIVFTNGVSGTPSVEGAVFGGCPYDPTVTTTLSKSDITLDDYCSIAYNQAVVGAIATSSLKTTTMVTQIVPGSWQQLPPED